MKLSLKKTELRIDLLTLLFPLFAVILGGGTEVCLLLLALTAHESAHLAAARAVHAGIRSVRLTPFGGMMQLENPYLLPPLRLIAIAAAGPAANLLLILSAAALCHWRFLPPAASLEFIRINAALMLFNLFPALPLDGGRILWALLSTRISRERSLNIAVLGGRILACALILLSLSGFIAHGQLNLSMPIAAVFLLVSGQDERIALRNSRADALLSGLRPLSHPETAELIAVDTSTPPREALLSAHTDRRPIFALYRHGRLLRIVDEQTLMDLLTSEKTES